MTNILMYNTATQALMEVPDHEADRFRESGWQRVEGYDLVAVYSPTLNRHRTVLKADVRTWLNQGYYAEPTVVYHPEQGARTVSADEAAHLYGEGWYDTPAKFPRPDARAAVETAVKAMKEAGAEAPAKKAGGK
jgi:hypothetical protein